MKLDKEQFQRYMVAGFRSTDDPTSDRSNGTAMLRGRPAIAATDEFGYLYARLLNTAPPNQWAITATGASGAQATVSQAAGAAGVRNVAYNLCAAFTTAGAAAANGVLVLRDGATGVGTILWSLTLSAPANSSAIVNIPHLDLRGTAATAMTIEFTAGVVGAIQSVSLVGYEQVDG